MKIQINITKEILEQTKICESRDGIVFNCAISVAVRSIFPHAWVDNHEIIPFAEKMTMGEFSNASYNKPKDNYIQLPNEAKKFVNKFDYSKPEQREALPPFSFEIEVNDNIIDRIGIKEAEEIIANSLTLELVS